MSSQVARVVERSPASRTFVRLLSGVREHVTTKIPRNGELFRALLALVRPLARVRPHVDHQRTRLFEPHRTMRALVTLFICRRKKGIQRV